MAEILAICIGLCMLLSPQIIAGLIARSMGRKFWFWFFISFLLPVISIFILLSKEDKSGRTGYKLADHVKNAGDISA